MSYMAVDKRTDKLVFIGDLLNPKSIPRDTFKCQSCDENFFVRAGATKQIRVHFSHYGNRDRERETKSDEKEGCARKCKGDWKHHPESYFHMLGKLVVYEKLCKDAELRGDGSTVRYEQKIPSLKRIADVMLNFTGGATHAHEVQFAKITERQLRERTNDYLDQGVNISWWLGGAANTPGNREWVLHRLAEVHEINWTVEPYVVSDVILPQGFIVKPGDPPRRKDLFDNFVRQSSVAIDEDDGVGSEGSVRECGSSRTVGKNDGADGGLSSYTPQQSTHEGYGQTYGNLPQHKATDEMTGRSVTK